MGKRRDARVRAVQFLYQVDSLSPSDLDRALADFWDLTGSDQSAKQFALPRIAGVLQHRNEIDESIASAATHWKISRMVRVDLAILRLAVFEMRYLDEVPQVVAINEAVAIAKILSTEDSGSFVNGVLDRIRRQMNPSPVS